MKRAKSYRLGKFVGQYVVVPLLLAIIIAALLGILAIVGMFIAATLGYV